MPFKKTWRDPAVGYTLHSSALCEKKKPKNDASCFTKYHCFPFTVLNYKHCMFVIKSGFGHNSPVNRIRASQLKTLPCDFCERAIIVKGDQKDIQTTFTNDLMEEKR